MPLAPGVEEAPLVCDICLHEGRLKTLTYDLQRDWYACETLMPVRGRATGEIVGVMRMMRHGARISGHFLVAIDGQPPGPHVLPGIGRG